MSTTDVDVARDGRQGRVTFGRALGWSMIGSSSRQAVTLAVTFVLAVVLSPADFGTASLALALVIVYQTLLQHGFLPALVGKTDLEEDDLSTAYWLLLSASVAGVLAVQLVAEPVAALVGAPGLGPVLRVLSLFLVLDALAVPFEAVMRRRLDARALALRGVLSATAGGAVGMPVALLGGGVWALVAQQLTMSATGLVVVVLAARWHPRLLASRSSTATLLPFAWRSGLAGLGQALNARTDLLLVGVWLGPAAAGLYRLAGRVVEAAQEVTCRAVATVSLAELARTPEEQLAARTRSILERTALISAPVLGVVAGMSGPLTRLVGEDWAPAAPVLSVLCVSSLLTALTSVAPPLLQRRARAGLTAMLSWGGALTGVAVFTACGLLASGWQTSAALLAFAYGRVVVQLGELCAAAGLVAAQTRQPVRSLVSPCVPLSVGAGLLAASAGSLVDRTWSASGVEVLLVGSVAAALCGVLPLLASRSVRRAAAGLVRQVRRCVRAGSAEHSTPAVAGSGPDPGVPNGGTSGDRARGHDCTRGDTRSCAGTGVGGSRATTEGNVGPTAKPATSEG